MRVGLRVLLGYFAIVALTGVLLAQVFGRLGNYFNHELFGLPTDLPWGLEIPAGNPAIPMQRAVPLAPATDAVARAF